MPNELPQITNIIMGNYLHNNDSNTYHITIAISLTHPDNFANINIEMHGPNKVSIAKVNEDSVHKMGGTLSQFVHFKIEELYYDTDYLFNIVDNNHNRLLIAHPMGNKEDEPVEQKNMAFNLPNPSTTNEIKIAMGGDQEVIGIIPDFDAVPAEERRFTHKILEKIRDVSNIHDHRRTTQEIYSEIAQGKYNIFLHLSDMIYGESLAPGVYRVKELEEFRWNIEKDFHVTIRDKLASMITLRIMDDHDYGVNSMSSTIAEEDNQLPEPYYKNALKAFYESIPIPSTPDNPQQYYHFNYGFMGIWCLDSRLNSGRDENYRLLGKTQYDWLEDQLKNSPAEVKFIVTSLPFLTGKKPDEDYRGSHEEWLRLMRLFHSQKVSAIFCADSHNYSRTDICFDDGTIIPQFLVGSLGGFPQRLKDDEVKKLPHVHFPPNFPVSTIGEFFKSKVQAYLHPHFMASPRRWDMYTHNSSTNEMEVKKIRRNTYGFMGANINKMANGQYVLNTKFFAKSKKDLGFMVLDKAQYLLRLKR